MSTNSNYNMRYNKVNTSNLDRLNKLTDKLNVYNKLILLFFIE